MKPKTKITYDKNHDVFYITTGDKTNAHGEEDENGVVTLKNPDSNITVGYIIMDFNKKIKDKSIHAILKRYNIEINIEMFS